MPDKPLGEEIIIKKLNYGKLLEKTTSNLNTQYLFKIHLLFYLNGCRVGGSCFQLALFSALLNMGKVASEILLRTLFKLIKSDFKKNFPQASM